MANVLMKRFFLFALVSKESTSSLLSSASSHLPRIWFYSPNKCSPFISVHSSIPCKSSGLTQPKTARGLREKSAVWSFKSTWIGLRLKWYCSLNTKNEGIIYTFLAKLVLWAWEWRRQLRQVKAQQIFFPMLFVRCCSCFIQKLSLPKRVMEDQRWEKAKASQCR